jgi:hypothetical protein
MAKAKIPTDEKFEKQDFDLFEALAAIDRKDYGYYDSLTEEQQRKFSPYMMVRWMSSIKGNTALQQYHVLSTNEFANTHLFSEFVNKHPKLQWLMLCASGLGNGKQFHQFLKPNKLDDNDLINFLSSIYPTTKISDLKILASIITTEELEQHIRDSGN